MLTYTPTPVQELHDPIFDTAGVRVLVKREDLNHPFVSGNKWWKLKYNLEEAKKQNHKTLLTFGGAYSNHIFATAAAAHELGFDSIGVIRGEETLPLNDTLNFAAQRGMKLHYVSREKYRNKNEAAFINELHKQFRDFYLIPEGGTNQLAIQGCEEFAQTLNQDFDYVCCSVGTGGTLAGLINVLPADKTILGFSSLKNGEFLQAEVEQWLTFTKNNWQIVTDFHFGGYGKTPESVQIIQKELFSDHRILFDLIYGSKMMAGVWDLLQKGFFRRNSTILIIHTGGLQGKVLP